MAERSFSSGSRDLSFITENPATEAFREGEKAARANMAADLSAQHAQVANVEQMVGAPTRLRTLNAESDRSRADADVATRTVNSRVATSGANASLAGTNATVAAQTAPYKVQAAYDSAREGQATADVAVGTAPTRVESAKVGLRQANATALNTEMQGFYKSLDLLKTGDTAGAVEVARQHGQTIPREVIENQEARDAVVRAADHAKLTYPNRPKDAQVFMQGFLEEMGKRRASGQPANDPAAPYAVPNAPEPQEDTTRSSYELVHRQETDEKGQPVVRSYKFDKSGGTMELLEGSGAFNKAGREPAGGGGAGRKSVFQQKQEAWEAVHPGDKQGALDYANGRRQMSEPEIQKSSFTQASRELQGDKLMAYKPAAERTQWVTRRQQEIASIMRGGAPATAAPAAIAPRPAQPAAPAPAAIPAMPPGLPPGSQYSPSRKMWRTPDGAIFNADGSPVQ